MHGHIATLVIILILALYFSRFLSPSTKVEEPMSTQITADKTNGTVGIAVLMRKPVDLPLWLKHHRDMGVQHFFIRMEDTPGWEDMLKTQPDVSLTLAESDKANNYETLQTRQIEFVNTCIGKCPQHNIQWLFHVDADELLEGDLRLLRRLPTNIKCIVVENVEAVFDGSESTCFDAKKFLKCSNKAPCRSYANGKAAGRVEDGVQLKGPHNFSYKGSHEGDHVHRFSQKELCVLHFDSCSFGAWSEKFQHLANNGNDSKVPFPYYKDSMKVASEAYSVYKNSTHKDVSSLGGDQVYVRA
jgi:hypothetical protein